jgi:hypothetical protein
MAGEPVWLVLVAGWAIALTARWSRRWFVFLPATGAVAILFAHAQGFKLYGSPTIGDNRPLLVNPLKLVALEPPSTIVAENGMRYTLRGVTLSPHAAGVQTEDLQRWFHHGYKEPIRFIVSDTHPSGFAVEWRREYFCGNTFFPHALVTPLPSHSVHDLGERLQWLHLAEQPDEAAGL